MYRHHAPTKPISLQMDADTELPLPRPQTFAGSLRTERAFGTFYPNEDFPQTTKNDSMPSPQEGLAAKDEVVLRLAHLRPENEGQKARQAALLGQLADILEQVSELMTEVNNDRTTRLTIEHRAIRIQGRQAEQRLERASKAFTEKDVYALNLISAQDQARRVLEGLHDLEQRGEHLKRFHSDKEASQWKQRVEESKTLAVAAAEMAREAVAERAQAQEELTAAREEVNRLAGIESRIRSELRGTPHWDAETGLGEPGAGVMTTEILDAMSRDE